MKKLIVLVSFVFVTGESCKVFADLTTNRLTRVKDGTLGLWSYQGIAKESHASQTSFTFNGDLIDKESFHAGHSLHTDLATFSDPLLGLTSDTDEDYLEYLILQAITANIDGFLVEWGYKGHPSDFALKRLIKILHGMKLSKRKFCIGINWCDHWLKQHLQNATAAEMTKVFYASAQYLLDSFFIPFANMSHFYHLHPVILLFGGGITSEEFSDVLEKPFKMPQSMRQPIWIGNYLNIASNSSLRYQWSSILNGTFAWVSHAHPTPPWLSSWDTYSLPQDTVLYLKNVSELSNQLVLNKTWCYWMTSANPGEDNRGCAGWGQTLKYVPRTWDGRNTYEAQWKYNLNSTANTIFLPTMNDYSESTVLLPTKNYGFTALTMTLKYSSLWKRKQTDYKGIKQPAKWFILKRKVRTLKLIPSANVSDIIQDLNKVKELIINGNYSSSYILLTYLRMKLNTIEERIFVNNRQLIVPSKEIYPVHTVVERNGSYLIDFNHHLYLQMNDSFASVLRTKYFKGMLIFDYQSNKNETSTLRVESSTRRTEKGTLYIIKNSIDRKIEENLHVGDFSIVCQLTQQDDAWKHAAVELYKENLDWSHNKPYSSDVVFLTEKKESLFFVKNITFSFLIYG